MGIAFSKKGEQMRVNIKTKHILLILIFVTSLAIGLSIGFPFCFNKENLNLPYIILFMTFILCTLPSAKPLLYSYFALNNN